MLLYLYTLTEELNKPKIEKIYNAHHKDMMDYAKIRLWSSGRKNYAFEAEDAVQNTFVKVTRNIDKIDFLREEKYIRGYVISILVNEINNILREKEFVSDFGDSVLEKVEFNNIETLMVVDKYNDAIAAIRQMDEKYSTALYLAICEEMSVKEIAKMMGISEKTVYTRIMRAKKKVIDAVEEVSYNG